jgi:hypothetical protein
MNKDHDGTVTSTSRKYIERLVAPRAIAGGVEVESFPCRPAARDVTGDDLLGILDPAALVEIAVELGLGVVEVHQLIFRLVQQLSWQSCDGGDFDQHFR